MSHQELGIISPPEQSESKMLRAKEVRRKMREANPRLLTPTAPIDLETWAYVKTNDLIQGVLDTGMVEEEEIERLENFFEVIRNEG